jgi:GTPase SAR1 family protein
MVDLVENVSISVENNNNSSLNITRYKVVFIGDVSVGKTSILNRFLENKFSEVYQVLIFFNLF